MTSIKDDLNFSVFDAGEPLEIIPSASAPHEESETEHLLHGTSLAVTEDTQKTRFEAAPSGEQRCAYCREPFKPIRRAQTFCGAQCRQWFYIDLGATGKVASVRKIKNGVSVTLHFSGSAAVSALALEFKSEARIVPTPF